MFWSYGIFCKFLHILYASVAIGIDLVQIEKNSSCLRIPFSFVSKKKKKKTKEKKEKSKFHNQKCGKRKALPGLGKETVCFGVPLLK